MDRDDATAFQMTGRQQLVYRSLAEKSESLAALYECALRVMWDGSNPGRVLLAAHSIREMMGGLPSVLALPVLAEQGRLGDQVNALEPIWNGAANSRCHRAGEWAGEIGVRGARSVSLRSVPRVTDLLRAQRARV